MVWYRDIVRVGGDFGGDPFPPASASMSRSRKDIFGTMPMHRTSLCSVLFLAALGIWSGLTGCAKVGPDYRQPDPAAPAAWRAPAAGGLSFAPAEQQLLAEWWTALKDRLLT